jgi:hypothetical protein
MGLHKHETGTMGASDAEFAWLSRPLQAQKAMKQTPA